MFELFRVDDLIMMEFTLYFSLAINLLILSFYFVSGRTYKIEKLIYGNIAFILQHLLVVLAITQGYKVPYFVNAFELLAFLFYSITMLELLDLKVNIKKYIVFYGLSIISMYVFYEAIGTISSLRAVTTTAIALLLIELIYIVLKSGKVFQNKAYIYSIANIVLFLFLKLFVLYERVTSSSMEQSVDSINNSIVVFTFLMLVFVLWYNLTILYLNYSILSKNYRDLGYIDSLTNIYNRRYIYEKLEEYHQLQKRRKLEFTIVMYDLDDFKHINDKYGHTFGDHVIQKFAETIQAEIRDIDVFARYGGDEFLLLLHVSKGDEIKSVVDRINQAIDNITLDENLGLSASSGVLVINEFSDYVSVDRIIEDVDKKLYKDKNNR